MKTPEFLLLGEVLEIHQDQLARYGGMPGVRDMGLLQLALAMPAGGMGGQYFHEDQYEMAAAYLFHIARNHPFVDGNKRTAAVAALVFLALNGVEIEADEDAFELMVRAVAEGRMNKSSIADFFREHSG